MKSRLGFLEAAWRRASRLAFPVPPTPRAASRAAACAPRGAGRSRGRVFHPGRVEGRSPAALVLARELQIVALSRHPDDDVSDPGPRVEPGAESVERATARGHRAPGEPERRNEESAALVKHGYSITWSARSSTDCGIVSPSALAVLRLMTSSNFVGCSTGRSPGLAPLRILSM